MSDIGAPVDEDNRPRFQLAPVDAAGLAPIGELAYASVRTSILRGHLKGDQPVREADLVRQLGISRTPIREALRRLQAEGLLRRTPEGAYVVVEWDPEELTKVYAVRIALERLAARTAAEHRSRVDLAELADTVDEITAAMEHQPDALPALNMRFHLLVARASGNSYLHSTLSNIAEIFHRYPGAELTLAGRGESALAEHQALLLALERRDADLAEQLIGEHLQRGMDALLALCDAKPARPAAAALH